MGSAFALLLLVGAAASRVPLPDDPVLRDVEVAYAILRADHPGAQPRARRLLDGAAHRLDDLDPDRTDVQRVLQGADDAPWRGLPHERALTLLTLASLDVAAGRCDVALPTIRAAEHHRIQARLQQPDVANGANDDDALLSTVLRLRCGDDVDGVDEAIRTMALAPAIRLVFRGRTPAIEAAGSHGETGVLRADSDDGVAFTVTIGTRRSRSSSSTTTTTSTTTTPSTRQKTPFVVWDAGVEARGPGPASQALRSGRAASKQRMGSQASGWAGQGVQAASQVTTAGQAVGAALLLSASAGMGAVAATVDARVDTRTAPSMPARVVLEIASVNPR